MADAEFVARDYRSRYASLAGMSDAQLLEHWTLVGKAAGLTGRFSEEESLALRRDRFKPADYRSRYADMHGKSDPETIEHFLAFGRAEGRIGRLTAEESAALDPERFDPAEYLQRYPDLTEMTEPEAVAHFLALGRAEGRFGRFTSPLVDLSTERIDAGRATVLVVLHEASRTGAPLLAWSVAREYTAHRNVVVLLRRGGPVLPAFDEIGATVIVTPEGTFDSAAELEILAKRIAQVYAPRFAVAATSAVFAAVPPIAESMPLVLLVHEFAPTRLAPEPVRAGVRAAVATSRTAFSSETVRDSYLREFDDLDPSRMVIIRQGLYARPEPKEASTASSVVPAGSRLVLGVGSLNQRKGVDVFVQAAALALRADPDPQSLKFVWVGSRDPASPSEYEDLLAVQVANSGLADNFSFVSEVDDLDPFYAAATATFVSSRLDPLPNSALDAFGVGVPVVTFAGAGGISEIMSEDTDAAHLVVPYLDSAAAASVLSRLVTDVEWRSLQSGAARRVLEACLDLPAYAAAVARVVAAES